MGRKKGKIPARDVYIAKHNLTRAWISNDLRDWLQCGRFGQTVIQSSQILSQFLESDPCFEAYNVWLLTRPDLNKED
jgi:hypothetical protein